MGSRRGVARAASGGATPGNQPHAWLRLVRAFAPMLDGRPLRHVLNGSWLGHAFHPVLTDFADGAWMGGSLLDVFGPASLPQPSFETRLNAGRVEVRAR